MDGRMAVLFGVMSFFGDGVQGDGWNVARADVAGMATSSVGATIFKGDPWGQEARVTYNFKKWKRFNPIIDFSLTEKGGAWLGLGLYQQYNIDIGTVPLYAGFTFAPGLYMQGQEVDLGLPLEFRSGVEIGVRFGDNWQASLSYDHRSNGDFSEVNPGIETIQLRISKRFN